MSLATSQAVRAWQWTRGAWDRLVLYLPVILMGALALGTYWLATNTPSLLTGEASQRPVGHDPDYFMRAFSVKTFDPAGRLKSEVTGREARHYPDTNTLEIDGARIVSFNPEGQRTVATAQKALSNSDGSEVQLMGQAVVVRWPGEGANAAVMEFRGEFLHAFLDTERVKSHLPVTLRRGGQTFSADSMDFDNRDRVMELRGRVRGTLEPGPLPRAAR